MIVLQRQFGHLGEEVFKNDIEPGCYPADQRVDQSPQQGGLAAPEKFVEYQHCSARPQNAGDFSKTVGRLRDHGQNQMQHGVIEAGIGEGQALGVALYWRKVEFANARQGALQHGTVEVEADVMMLWRQMGQIQPGADAGQQDPAGFGGQGGQAALAGGLRGAANCRIVKRGNQRVAMLQAQCKTLGMASANSGISALKCVPSSATIW